MKKLLVMIWCLLVLPLGINGVYAQDNPTVTYDASVHEFAVDNTSGLDFFNGMKNVIPGDTRIQKIDLQYTHVAQDLSVYLSAQCKDTDMIELLKDATMDIYVDGHLVSENQWIFDGVLIGEVQESGLHEMEVHLHIPTSLGNEIAGKSMLLQWVLTVQEEEAVQTPTETPDVSVIPDDSQDIISPQPSVTPSSGNQNDSHDDGSMMAGGQLSQNQGVPLEGELDEKDDTVHSTIIDENVPLSGVTGSWALINLISMILTIILAILMFIRKQNKDKEDEDKQDVIEYKRRRWIPVCGVIVSIVSLIVFVLTEDMTLKMAYVDRYTIGMIVLLVINVVLFILGRTWKEKDNQERNID